MSKNLYYILDANRNVVEVESITTWGLWFNRADRVVARINLTPETTVSTVFLGMDHNYSDRGEPILWESLVFGGPMDGEMFRCSGTWQDAEAMHLRMVASVLDGLGLTGQKPPKRLRKLS